MKLVEYVGGGMDHATHLVCWWLKLFICIFCSSFPVGHPEFFSKCKYFAAGPDWFAGFFPTWIANSLLFFTLCSALTHGGSQKQEDAAVLHCCSILSQMPGPSCTVVSYLIIASSSNFIPEALGPFPFSPPSASLLILISSYTLVLLPAIFSFCLFWHSVSLFYSVDQFYNISVPSYDPFFSGMYKTVSPPPFHFAYFTTSPAALANVQFEMTAENFLTSCGRSQFPSPPHTSVLQPVLKGGWG